ncbi:MAG: hypothetical protein PHY93_04250 [Bacteriovorax sp.]|nr:hypothetical protein [Bacteriovorax sp.]
MRKIKYLSHFSYLFIIAFIAVMAITTPIRSMAQDDMPNDEETIIPSSNNSAPPPIIDESDSGAVNDVEEYDG